ncbi:UDP-N-acetylglucosamine 4,6-dehydratase (configuration-retaining) [Campylobacter pinnipediorum]|uniref:UDP-N-acetylglucosamine 4,6-dehydratase n=1 Tax=Campylobacter pinnipediorum subsp. pinnipediorum TaxID=1660067 RepID=A0AAX0LC27_9BACT|nr:UDP-N-acetylglucosamine 4,6-dehydratase (configuration-retaining) [Campylobacter pinnipediorum]AQW83253.1 UDP-N-acetylglucosamine C-6 dehydratase [Campylobacter pinnipediorum subsp. pinnipediorum]OPA81924.1 UDP-N-acetylglucosamine 4,6-dehydratase [Campylobacter pinnipediorum subsp. pinnipediorum]
MLKTTKLKRLIFFIFGDIVLFCISIYFAFLLRFNGFIPDVFYTGFFISLMSLNIIKLFFMWFFKIYRVPWRFFGLNEARKIFIAHFFSFVSFYILFLYFQDLFNPFPRSVIFIDFVISYLFIGGFRISKRMFLDFSVKTKQGKACIVIGATNKTIQIFKGLKDGYIDDFYAVGVFDKRQELIGTYCGGFLVQDKTSIKKIVDDYGVKTAIIALNLNQNELKELFDELMVYGIRDIKLFSLIEDNPIKDIRIEDLLARKPKDLDQEILVKFICDKVVLVTGAGGSIGSEIVKQCLKFGSKKIILADNSEFNLYKISEETNDARCICKMVDITNLQDIENIFLDYKPDIVIHAAAYKHVFLCELNPLAAVKNNVIGTKNIIDLSKKYNVKKVVVISSDKAVRPTNIMGATKRVCELYALNSNEDSSCEIVCVRFGNVLGSSGSVIPKFKSQIAQNKPLSVTHPEITRYFMLTSEACQLVLQAASIASGGELFVLDMGEPVKILDLAKKMLFLSNKEHLGVKFVGLKMGEKLYEELLVNKDDIQTKFESIFVTKYEKYDIVKLNKEIQHLITLKNDKICEVLKDIVPDFNHELNLKD